MKRSTLIIINGPAGVGKTTLARKLAAHLHLPYLSKDDIKELLFDTLGWKDREWSKRLGHASFVLLHREITLLLAAGQSLIVETVFRKKEDSERLAAYKDRCRTIEIRLISDGDILFERFKQRSETDRHPGHRDHLNYDEFESYLRKGELPPIGADETLTVDMTDLAQVDDAQILKDVEALMEKE